MIPLKHGMKLVAVLYQRPPIQGLVSLETEDLRVTTTRKGVAFLQTVPFRPYPQSLSPRRIPASLGDDGCTNVGLYTRICLDPAPTVREAIAYYRRIGREFVLDERCQRILAEMEAEQAAVEEDPADPTERTGWWILPEE